MVMGKGEIQILIKAKDEASKKLGVINKNVADMSKQYRMAGMAMVAVGSAITATVGMSLKAFAKAGDEVQKMALRTGFATETLSELKHACEISGASLQVVDVAAKRMSKTIVDANEGMATYIRAFDRIGLSVSDLMAMKPEDQFMAIALAIAELEDHTIKAATAQDIFGRSGTQLLPLLAQGADGIKKLREEAHRLGIVFDKEAAEKAAELTDAFHRMGEAVSGLKFQLGEVLAPTITDLADKITGFTMVIREWGEENKALYETLAPLVTIVGLLAIPTGIMLTMLPSLAAGFAMVKAKVVGLVGALGAYNIALAVGVGMIIKGAQEIQRYDKGAVEHAKLVERQTKLEQYHITVMQEHDKAMRGEANNYERMLDLYNKTLLAHYESIDAMYAEMRVVSNLADSFREYLKTVEEAAKKTGEMAEAQEVMVEVTEKLTIAQKNLGEEYAKWYGKGGLLGAYPGGVPGRALVGKYGEAWALAAGTPGRAQAMLNYAIAAIARGVTGYTQEQMAALARATYEESKSYQYGGVVRETGLAMVHRGEYVLPTRGGGRAPINIINQIYLDGEQISESVIERITEQVRLRGGL